MSDDLNRRCAEAMGWHEWTGEDDYSGPLPMFRDWDEGGMLAVYTNEETGDVEFYWNPAERIADAWVLVEKMRENGWTISWDWDDTGHAVILKRWRHGWEGVDVTLCPTFPRAICEAVRNCWNSQRFACVCFSPS